MNPTLLPFAFKKTIPPLLLALGFVTLLFLVTWEPAEKPETAEAGKKSDSHRLARNSDLPSAAKRHVVQEYGRLPLEFETNRGQVDQDVKFLSRGDGYSLFLTSNEAVLSLRRSKPSPRRGVELPRAKKVPQPRVAPAVVRMQFVNANPAPSIEVSEQQPGKSNYFIGNDPAKWRTNVPHYGRVQYHNVWPGVDVAYYGNQRNLEYDFVVSPGADLSHIRLKFVGVQGMYLNRDGDLRLKLPGGQLLAKLPNVYQQTSVGRKQVLGHYQILANGEVSFGVDAYDRSSALVIDPVLVYSTYLGGSGNDVGLGIAVDTAGSAYITGFTDSPNFPTMNPIPSSQGTGIDAFVTKLNPAGTALVYSTYLGGSQTDDGTAIAVDPNGVAFLTGWTSSPDFPTVGAIQSTPNVLTGEENAFVAQINASGSALVYSLYVGGTGSDFGYGIAIDGNDNAYVVGTTTSADFPNDEAFQSTGGPDAFILEVPFGITATTSDFLVFSDVFGGPSGANATGIARDSSGGMYITGGADEGFTPAPLENAYQANPLGSEATFVLKLAIQSDTPIQVYSTYIGGGINDSGLGIAVDSAGNAYVAGITSSAELATMNALQTTFNGDASGFAAKLDSTGSTLTYYTYLGGGNGGGGGTGAANAIAVDANGNAYVVGDTYGGLPTVSPIQSSESGASQDAFVTVLSPLGSTAVFSTYLGGSNTDVAYGVALDSNENIYLTGRTNSIDFPVVSPYQTNYAGGDVNPSLGDAFVTKISLAAAGLSVAPSQLVFTSVFGGPAPPSQNLTVTFQGTINATATSTTPPNVAWLGVAVNPPNTTAGTTILTVTATPNGLSPGTYTGFVTVSATESSASSENVPVTYIVTTPYVPPPPAPQITSACPASPVVQNSSLTQTLLATGGNGAYMWTIIGSLPAGLSLTGNTISGTITAAPGVYSFGIDVTSGGQFAGVSCSLTVTAPQLQITGACPGNGAVSDAYGPFTLGATGGVASLGYQFSIVGGSLPPGVGLNGNVISGTPTNSGTFTFSIQVASGKQTATAGPCSVIIASALTITGTCPAEAQAGAPISASISVSGGMLPYTFGFSGSAGLSFSNPVVSGTVSGVGTASFNVTVSDSAKSSQPFSCTFPVTADVQIMGTCPAGPIAQGAAFSLPLTGSGGTPPLGWSLSGPSWLSTSGATGSGISVTGTPPASGTFSFSVSLADSKGSSSTPFSCTLTVKPKLQITPSASCPASPLPFQSAFSLSFTASNGTMPYSWTYSGASWLALSTRSGGTTTLKGTASEAGTFPFTITLSDSANSIPTMFSCTLTVSAPVIPDVSVTGSSPTQDLTPVTAGLSLAAPALVNLTGTVTLTFTQNASNPITDPADYGFPTFEPPCSGTTTCSFTIPAGQTAISQVFKIGLGTVAGTIHLEVTGLSDGIGSVLPATPPSLDLVIPRLAPVLMQGCFANQSSTGYNIVITGYSTPRDMSSDTVTFTAASGATITGSAQFTQDVSGLFMGFYQTPSVSTSGGSTFGNLQIPVTLSGDTSAIATVTVTLKNSVGTSAPLTISGTCASN